MNVNGVTTPPVVYIPTQVIAPSVPNPRPIGLPTTDRKADPTPLGTPFVEPKVTEKAVEHGRERHPLLPQSSMVTAPTTKPSVVTVKVEPKAAAPHAPAAARPGAFDKYA